MMIQKVAMVGAGTMGNQIAMQVAISGYDVTCYSRKETTVASAKNYSDGWFAKSVEKGKMTVEDAEQAKGKLKFTTDLVEAVTDADVVIEAVPDVLKTKREILGKISGALDDLSRRVSAVEAEVFGSTSDDPRSESDAR